MKEDILSKLNMAINALNNVSVMGKTNLNNLAGSITILEDIRNSLRQTEFKEDPA